LEIACVSTGTHPIADWRHIPISDGERYHRLVENMQWPARRLLICGLHVHVGVRSGEHAIAIMNALTVFLPHLLALSGSSPYWHALDTGMASCRTKVFEGLPTAGLPPQVANWAEFTSLMRTLLHAGSITSIREIWWDIRPHTAFGTVEVRVCDGVNTLGEVCAITALIQSLTAYLQERYDAGEPLPTLRYWTLRENKWRASRFGTEAQVIRNECGQQIALTESIADWVERLRPTARRLGCESDLLRNLDILRHGPSYQRQRRMYDRAGSLEGVVDDLVSELRNDTPWVR
jgi:carboxylate-amine ligase